MYLRFKIVHKVFIYIKLIYNYLHNQKGKPSQGHKVFNYVKTYIQVFTRQKENQFKGISSLKCSKTYICTCSYIQYNRNSSYNM